MNRWTLFAGILLAGFLVLVVIPKVMEGSWTTAATVPTIPTRAAAAAEADPAAAAAAAAAAEAAAARLRLETQFNETTARAEIPDDYPRLSVGTCPYSKPMSADLPIRDMPRCRAVSAENMYLADRGAAGACALRTMRAS